MEEVRHAANQIARTLTKGQHAAWELGITDDEVREVIAEAAEAAGEAILRDDYDTFKHSVATVTALGFVDGGRRKWLLADVAGDAVWKANVAQLDAEIAADVEAFLEDVFGAG